MISLKANKDKQGLINNGVGLLSSFSSSTRLIICSVHRNLYCINKIVQQV
jgi:hypothetical protein